MRKLTLAVICLFAAPSFATSSILPGPAYVCSGDNDLDYDFHNALFQEIHIYDHEGNEYGDIDSITYSYEPLQTLAPSYQILVTGEDNENVATLYFEYGAVQGVGSIISLVSDERVELECSTVNSEVNF